ncbi:MAG: amidohydrolase family protein [Pirellulaceae bacterium]
MKIRNSKTTQRVLGSQGVFASQSPSGNSRVTRICSLALAFVCLCWCPPAEAHDQIPGKPQSQPIAIVGATIHPIVGDAIEGGVLLFEKGKITAIGENVELPGDCRVIDAEGKHLYPSIVEAYSDTGLVEINSVRATIDSREIGEFNPNIRAVTAFNPDSEIIPVNRANGVLLSVTAPSGGAISGRSSMMMLDGWTWEDMTLQADVGMHLSWSSRDEALESLEKFVEQAKRYGKLHTATDLRLEAMQPVLRGEMPVIASTRSAEDIRMCVAFAKRHGLKLILLGGNGTDACAELLKELDIPVIISGVYRNPGRRHAAYDGPYALPSKLEEEGVSFCISAGGRFGATGVRNLPYHAATAVAYGLDEASALEAITLAPARILGLDDRVGSLQVGLDATLFIADGDILETPTHVTQAFVQGREVDLDNKHSQLYRKYLAKQEKTSSSASDKGL